MNPTLKIYAVLSFKKDQIQFYVALYQNDRILTLFNRTIADDFILQQSLELDISKTLTALKTLVAAATKHCGLDFKRVTIAIDDDLLIYKSLRVEEKIRNYTCKQDVTNLFFLALNKKVIIDYTTVNVQPLNYAIDENPPLSALPIKQYADTVHMNCMINALNDVLWKQINLIVNKCKLSILNVIAHSFAESQCLVAQNNTVKNHFAIVDWRKKTVVIKTFLNKKFNNRFVLTLGLNQIFTKIKDKLHQTWSEYDLFNLINLSDSQSSQSEFMLDQNNITSDKMDISYRRLNYIAQLCFKKALVLIEATVQEKTNHRSLQLFYIGNVLEVAGIQHLLNTHSKLPHQIFYEPFLNGSFAFSDHALYGTIYIQEMQRQLLNEPLFAVDYTPIKTNQASKRLHKNKSPTKTIKKRKEHRLPWFEFVEYEDLKKMRRERKLHHLHQYRN